VNSVRVPRTPSSVGYLRAVLREDLASLPEPIREDVALVASELLGNAVRHARALDDDHLVIDWGIGEFGVEIAVTDGGGPTMPVAHEAAPSDTGGRGLAIVASIAVRWGVERSGSKTTVWAVVPLRGVVVPQRDAVIRQRAASSGYLGADDRRLDARRQVAQRG
jgi:serine/threonine-protein kinase RsbW